MFFSSDEFREILFGIDANHVFQNFNSHITVPKYGHDTLMGMLYDNDVRTFGTDFMNDLLNDDVLGCPKDVADNTPDGLLTECKDSVYSIV